MVPGLAFTAALTPSEPLAPVPTGHGTSLAAPNVQVVGATAVRYEVNTDVVPEPSERCTTWMALLGKVAPLLSALIAGSFHVLIFPAKIPASVSPESFRSVTPERLYSTAMPPATHGMCTGSPTFAASSGFSATSEPAKSTVLPVSCWIPAPEPTLW